MNRGMKKLTVSAAHKVIAKNPKRLSTYLMGGPSYFCAAFEYRCSMTCSLSGTLYGDGSAYGLSGVGQPRMSAVLYWNQSTDPVVGIIGTSCSISAESCLTIETWVASSAVAYWSSSLSAASLW